MKRLLLSVMFIMLLCGCTADYELNINKNRVDDTIKISIPKSSIVEEAEDLESSDIYSTNSINYLKNSDLPALNDKEGIYEKTFNETDSSYDLVLKYTYGDNQLENSYFFTNCFENQDISIDDDSININLSGKFKCFSREEESLNFVIKTNNKVNSSNTEYGLFTNEYKWVINNENKDNVNIQISLSTDSKGFYYISRIVAVAFFVIVIGVIIIATYKIRNAKNVNDV